MTPEKQVRLHFIRKKKKNQLFHVICCVLQANARNSAVTRTLALITLSSMNRLYQFELATFQFAVLLACLKTHAPQKRVFCFPSLISFIAFRQWV
jgi:hypothetical protein